MKLITTPEDDPAFAEVVTSILRSVVAQSTPQIVTVIQIDNLFDHEWLKFSGKFIGAVGVWERELTLPPFNPKRVKSQQVYRLGESAGYEELEAQLLHVEQPSPQNLYRRVKRATHSGVFAWWSGSSLEIGKGSLMVYTQIGDQSSAWFASFERDSEWRLNKTKGISIEVMKSLMGLKERGVPSNT